MLIMELKQYVNEVRGYHGKEKKQLVTDRASLPERLRSVRNGAGLNQAEMARAT
jgi:hypothetical protein